MSKTIIVLDDADHTWSEHAYLVTLPDEVDLRDLADDPKAVRVYLEDAPTVDDMAKVTATAIRKFAGTRGTWSKERPTEPGLYWTWQEGYPYGAPVPKVVPGEVCLGAREQRIYLRDRVVLYASEQEGKPPIWWCRAYVPSPPSTEESEHRE